LATPQVQLDRAPGGSDKESWVLCSDGTVQNAAEILNKLPELPQEGDIIVSI
jgi:hypothetical protein